MEQQQVVNAVETYVLKVKFVEVFANESKATITLKFDKAIPGYVKNEDGTYTLTEVNTITEFRSRLTAQICDINEICAYYRGALGHGFNSKNATFIFQGSTVKINRTPKLAGEMREDGITAFERDSYVTDIIELEIPKMGKQFIMDDIANQK